MGIAALVLGIISLVLFFACGAGILAGVLAVVFGFLGMSKAKQIGRGRGMSIAGLVLGAVGIIGGILFLVLVTIGINNTADNVSDAFGPVDASDYQITTDKCSIDADGSVTFTGTIKNTAGRDLDVDVVGEIRNARTNTVLETPSDFVSTTDGDTSEWSLDTFLTDPVDITCKVTAVNNWFN